MNLGEAEITEHAQIQMIRRFIDEADVRKVLSCPEEILDVREGRIVAQREVEGYLLRVFIDIDRRPPEVVTVYRTSKIEKYRR
jgi:hypothetical protein